MKYESSSKVTYSSVSTSVNADLSSNSDSSSYDIDKSNESDQNSATTSPKSTALTTATQTVLSIFKGNVGPGCLSLPWSFSILGVPLGCFITAVMTLLVSWNAWTLVMLKRKFWGLNARGVTYSVRFSCDCFAMVIFYFAPFGQELQRFATISKCGRRLLY